MKTAVSTALIGTVVLCGALMAVGLLGCRSLLVLIRTPAELMADSAEYLDIYTLGLPFLFLYNVATGIFTALGDSRTEVKIISTRSDEIRTAILAEIDRGVTVLHGEGGYTGEPSEVLLSVISNRELPRLEKLVHSIDPACFLIVSRVTEVSGRGFSMEKEYQ